MAKGTQARYSIELDFTTGKAEQSVKAATDKIKERLNSIATEANKTKYFEGLIGDIHDVDAQLTQLKEKHGKDFESIYQGIGEGVRQEFESIFAYARSETEKFYAEIKAKQAEFSGLQQIQKDYKKYSKSAAQAISGAYVTGFGKSMDATQVQNMYNSFDKLLAKKAEFEKVGNTSSKEYLENYVQILKTASGLIKADAEVANDDKDFGIDVEALYNMAEKAKSILNSLDISGFASKITDATNSVKANLQEQMKSFAEEMPNRIKSAFSNIEQSMPDMSNQKKQNEEVALSYDKLKEKVKEYYDLVEERSNNPTKTRKSEIQSLQAEIQDEITGLIDESQTDTILDIFDKIDEGTIKSQDAILEFANILGMNIPQAFQKVSQSANTAEKSVQTVMYHIGNLLSGKKARDTFDQMPYNLTEAANGTRLEKFGFGALGSGLFGVTNPATINQSPAGSKFIQSIDLSKYNMYMADTEERATALIDFLSKLQKFSIKNAEPNYTGFDQQLNGVNIDSLYQQFKQLFVESDLTKEKLESFINDMIMLLQQAGLKFDEDTGSLDFTSIGKLEGTANISTRFMKMLGYQGVNVGTTSLDGLGQGSVLFDFDPSDIVGYFNTIDQAVQDYENITKQLNGNEWVGTIEQLQQYKQNIDDIINRLQEFKNSSIGQADSQNLEKTLSRLEQIKTKIDGAIAGNNESPFISITSSNEGQAAFDGIATSADEATASINQAESKVKEFLTLADEIQNKSFDNAWDATDNVEIGKYTERLNVAKAALDELGDQGRLTADRLEQVRTAFNMANTALDVRTKNYDAYASGYSSGGYDYYDEYERAQDKANELERENESLREQLNNQQQNTEQNISSNMTSELTQLENLRGKVVEVQAAIDAKTKAFEEEYVTVDAVVDAEIQSLQLLLNKLQEVLNQIDRISESFTKVNSEIAELNNTKDINVNENITSETTTEKVKKQESPSDNQFTKSLNQQISAFDKYRENLKDVSYISEDVRNKLDELGVSLRQVVDTAGLDDWKNSFADIQKEIAAKKGIFEKINFGYVNNEQSKLTTAFNKLTSEQKLELQVDFEQAIKDLEQYRVSIQEGKAVELDAINAVTAALRQKIDAYQTINKEAQKNQNFGSTAEINATAKFKTLKEQAGSSEYLNSSVVQQGLVELEASYNRLIEKKKQFANQDVVTGDDKAELKKLNQEFNNCARELNKVIVASQKLASKGTDIELLGGDFEDTETGRQNALKDFIETIYGASAKIGEFKDHYNQLTFAVDNGNGTFTQMTATINAARSAIVATAGDTGKATSAFGRFFNDLKGKFRTISTYLISSFSLQEVWQQIRRGVTYVREIDSALTELKKVTNETNATYENFLQTASKTASIIGSTVADFTNATADFARLNKIGPLYGNI